MSLWELDEQPDFFYQAAPRRLKLKPTKKGSSFDEAATQYPVEFCIDDGHNDFHFATWATIHEEWVTDFGFIDRYLTFTSEQSRDDFLAWMDAYIRRYPDDSFDTKRLPPLPKAPVKGTIMLHPNMNEYMADQDLTPIWAWMVDNLKGNVWFMPNNLVFENDSDSVLYKCRWL